MFNTGCARMFRAGKLLHKWVYTRQRFKQPIRTYKFNVMNETLSQLEAECEQYCRIPRFPPRKVTVVGAGSDVGRIVCLFLKQQPVIRILAMYDDHPCRNVLGVACDIAHIDTSTAVEAYQGRMFLKNALHDADVVLICGGHTILPPCVDTLDRDMFFKNMSFVRTMTIAIAQFAPHAIIAIQTPPVDANYALVKYTLKVARNFDPKKVLGVNSITAMRANHLFCTKQNIDPSTMSIPVVGGTGRCTRVPVFSCVGTKACPIKDPKVTLELTRLVREADELVVKVKNNNEQAHLSIGFSTARCITNIMKGIFESPRVIDSALVQQVDPERCYGMKYCATPVTVSTSGIIEYSVPYLNPMETKLLEMSKCDMSDMVHLGKCYGLGEDYYIHECHWYPPPVPVDCPVTPTTVRKKTTREKCDNFRKFW